MTALQSSVFSARMQNITIYERALVYSVTHQCFLLLTRFDRHTLYTLTQTPAVTPNSYFLTLRCTWQPDQQFRKGLDGLFKPTWHENPLTHTNRWTTLFLGLTTALWAITDEGTLWRSCSVNTRRKKNPSQALGGTQANDSLILMDGAACAAWRGGHDKKVGLIGKMMSNIRVDVANQPCYVVKKQNTIQVGRVTYLTAEELDV